MTISRPSRLIAIGEFAAATQLTPKALRLYDEQGLMRPATTDAATGYRYYRSDQVPVGRLIRTMREMDLSLAQIAEVVVAHAAHAAHAEALLRGFAQEVDRRYAREKRAFQTALMQMREQVGSFAPTIEAIRRDASTVAVWSFSAVRSRFVETCTAQQRQAAGDLARAGLQSVGESLYALIDPLTEEEGAVELLIPVSLQDGTIPGGITARLLPASHCAAVMTTASAAHVTEFAATLDAVFDWFDRHGHRALDRPLISLSDTGSGLLAGVLWAYEPDTGSARSSCPPT